MDEGFQSNLKLIACGPLKKLFYYHYGFSSIHYSHATLDHGENKLSPISVSLQAARCNLPFALHRPVSKVHTKEITKEKTKEKTRKKQPVPKTPYSSRRGHEGGCGEEQRFLTAGAQLLGLLPPLLFPFSPPPKFPFDA